MLKPGDRHYKAYVGPPLEYSFMGANQFNVLTTHGLVPPNYLLDVGCGGLRAGKLLIPYLDKGRYFGIEPEKWLVEEAIQEELGNELIEMKQATFVFCSFLENEWESDSFGVILMHSILSHCGPKMAVDMLIEARRLLKQDGSIFCTFCARDSSEIGKRKISDGWTYPATISYSHQQIDDMFEFAGLTRRMLNDYHPRQTWYEAK